MTLDEIETKWNDKCLLGAQYRKYIFPKSRSDQITDEKLRVMIYTNFENGTS